MRDLGNGKQLTEKQWRQLVYRFNLETCKVGKRYQRPCICRQYSECSECPFGEQHSLRDCYNWLWSKELKHEHLELFSPTIRIKDAEGYKEAEAIKQAFLALPKVIKGVRQ